jgi:hypothetical protein
MNKISPPSAITSASRDATPAEQGGAPTPSTPSTPRGSSSLQYVQDLIERSPLARLRIQGKPQKTSDRPSRSTTGGPGGQGPFQTNVAVQAGIGSTQDSHEGSGVRAQSIRNDATAAETIPSADSDVRSRRRRVYPDPELVLPTARGPNARIEGTSFQSSLLPVHGIRTADRPPLNPRKLFGYAVPETVLGISTKRNVLELNSPDWERIRHAWLEATAETISPIAAAIGGYFGLKAWMSNPRKAEKSIIESMRKSVDRAIDNLLSNQLAQTLAATAAQEIKNSLFGAVQKGLSSIEDKTIEALNATLVNAIANSGGKPLDAAVLKELLAPLAANINSTMTTVVLPAVMQDGQLQKNLIGNVTDAVIGNVENTLSLLVSNVQGLVEDGARAAIAATMFENLDFVKLAMGGVMLGAAAYTGSKLVGAYRAGRVDPIRVLQSEHEKAFKETQSQVAVLRPEIKKRIDDIDKWLKSRWFDKKHLDLNPTANIEIDEMMISDLLRIRREYLLNQPDQKKPVELWKTTDGQVRYIKEVAKDLELFPAELKPRMLNLFVAIAARSVFPGSSGPLTYDLRGIPGGGKDVLVNLFEKHTKLARDNMVMEPVRGIEGGAGEIGAKGWEFIGQKQFKTSDRQLLGQLGELKLRYGKLIEGWEHGMANGICYVPEALWADPTFQQVMKLILEPETNWHHMPSLGTHVWTGDTIFIFSSNEDDYIPPKPAQGQFSDGATRSRFDTRLDFTRVTDQARKAAADKNRDRAIRVLADPMGTTEMTQEQFEEFEARESNGEFMAESILTEHVGEIKDRYASVESYMLKKHKDAMDGARMQFAAQLTTKIAGDVLVEHALSTIPEGEEDRKLLEGYIENATLTPAELRDHMKTKDPKLTERKFQMYGVTDRVSADLIQYIDDQYDPMVELKRARLKIKWEELQAKDALYENGEGFRWEGRWAPGLKNRPKLDLYGDEITAISGDLAPVARSS